VTVVVQKYGGSSLADIEKIQHVARRIAATRASHYQVVVTCSAMGDTTDELIALAQGLTDHPDTREMDALLATGEMISTALVAIALKDIGCPAISLTGLQAGVQTQGEFGRARIAAVNPERILTEIRAGKVVIVAGFQGVNELQDVATLGRGASDITAVALAVALGAKRCEIYTDVEGIYTADPRLVPEARKLSEIDYEEMLELASLGAKMQPRSIELGALYQIPILVSSTFSEAPGTLIHGEAKMEIRNRVRGVALDPNVAKITVLGVADRPGIAATLLEPLAAANISVDTIVQNTSVENLTDFSFTVTQNDLEKALETVSSAVQEIGALGMTHDADLAKVSVVGTGMQNAPGYASHMFRVLANDGINIQMIATSEIRITCIVGLDNAEVAVRALHRAFNLESGD
jgi:aspartate kinase